MGGTIAKLTLGNLQSPLTNGKITVWMRGVTFHRSPIAFRRGVEIGRAWRALRRVSCANVEGVCATRHNIKICGTRSRARVDHLVRTSVDADVNRNRFCIIPRLLALGLGSQIGIQMKQSASRASQRVTVPGRAGRDSTNNATGIASASRRSRRRRRGR